MQAALQSHGLKSTTQRSACTGIEPQVIKARAQFADRALALSNNRCNAGQWPPLYAFCSPFLCFKWPRLAWDTYTSCCLQQRTPGQGDFADYILKQAHMQVWRKQKGITDLGNLVSSSTTARNMMASYYGAVQCTQWPSIVVDYEAHNSSRCPDLNHCGNTVRLTRIKASCKASMVRPKTMWDR